MLKNFFALVVILAAQLAVADYLVRTDGKKIEGQVMSKTADLITFKGTDKITYYFKTSQIASIIMVEKKEQQKETAPVTIPVTPKETPVYCGEKITIDVREMDIRDLLLSLAELGKFSIIIDQSIQGKVTMKLSNVPIDQIIDLLCRQLNIGKEKIVISNERSTARHQE